MLRNSFSLKHLSMITENFWTYCGQGLVGSSLFTEARYRIEKSVVKTLLNIFLTAKTEWPNVWTPSFLTILNSKILSDKKIVGHSKPFIKIIDILLLIVRFVKSSDQAIIQIIRKNKSILIFLINPSNCFTGTYLKPSQQLRWRSLWRSLRRPAINWCYKDLHLRSLGSLTSTPGTL